MASCDLRICCYCSKSFSSYLSNMYADAWQVHIDAQRACRWVPSDAQCGCQRVPMASPWLAKSVQTSAYRCPTCVLTNAWPSPLPRLFDCKVITKRHLFGVLTAGVFSCHMALLTTSQMQVTAFISFQHPDLGSKLLFLVIFHFLLVSFVISKELS